MRVFVTGSTGFIGYAIVKELIAAGHQVTGLARSAASAKKLTDAGALAQIGTVEDLDALRRGRLFGRGRDPYGLLPPALACAAERAA